MVRIENSEQTATTTPPANAKGIQFEGFAPHSVQKPGQQSARHGADLHLGNAYTHAAPDANSHCFGPCEKAKNWHPDQNDHGSHAQTWRKQHDEQAKKPMSLSEDGKYHVQPGDEIGEITRRALHAKGVDQPTPAQMTQMQKDIIDSSEKDNPTLKCNPGLLHEGIKLTIPGVKSEGSGAGTPSTNTTEVHTPATATTNPNNGTGSQSKTGTPPSEFQSDKGGPVVHLGPDLLSAAQLGSRTDSQTGQPQVQDGTGGATVRLGPGAKLLGGGGDGAGSHDIAGSGNGDHGLGIPNLHIELTPKPAPAPQPEAPKPDHWYNLHNLRDRLLDGLEALS